MRIVVLIFTCLALLSGCKKENPEKITLEEAKKVLPIYYNFLKYMVNEGYEFMDFHNYWYTDKNNLPEKLIVLRHDIHEWDISYAYYTIVIEQEILNSQMGTYYVRLDDPYEISDVGSKKYEEYREKYIEIIMSLKNANIDVQPHISPVDMYLFAENTVWAQLSKDSLINYFNQNYRILYFNDGIDLEITGHDFLNLNFFNDRITDLLTAYNKNWHTKTGLHVESYAAHGTTTPLNYAFGNVKILNQRFLLQKGIYKFETSCNMIKRDLEMIHDTYRPDWMENPSLLEPKRYQLLIHPYVWNDPASWRQENGF